MFDRDEHAHARACARLVNEGTTVHARSGGYRTCTRFARVRASPSTARHHVSARRDAHARTDTRRQQKWCATCDDARELRQEQCGRERARLR
jgi:hypothetical protein